MKDLPQPSRAELDLSRILRALSDPTRRSILRALVDGPRPCSAFEVDIAKSTLSQHLKALREAGLTHTRVDGRHHITTLRAEDVEARFPGLLRAAGIPGTSQADSQ
jgi:DNA-binding transcriptional ArsR family regulator